MYCNVLYSSGLSSGCLHYSWFCLLTLLVFEICELRQQFLHVLLGLIYAGSELTS